MNLIEGAGILRERLARLGGGYEPLAVTATTTLTVFGWLAVLNADDSEPSEEPRPAGASDVREYSIA